MRPVGVLPKLLGLGLALAAVPAWAAGPAAPTCAPPNAHLASFQAPGAQQPPSEEVRERRRRRREAREREAAAEEARRADLITFELAFPPERGGGTVAGASRSLDYPEVDRVVLEGEVELSYQDLELRADRLELDLESQQVVAEGNVVLDQGPRRLSGATLEFNLGTRTGRLTQASAFVEPDIFFEGAAIAKVDDDIYTVEDGTFTACRTDVPAWSFHLGRARVEVEGYARVHGASFRLRNVPVLYTPYILWPVKRERSSGFLVPNLGYSRRRGSSLGLAYYQVLGESYDTTFHADLYSEEFYGLGNEFRYHPTAGTRGDLLGYAVWDPEQDRWRWKAEWNHQTTDLPWGFRGVVTFQDFSDFDFFQEFEREFDRATLRFRESRGFASRNWGPHSLNLLLTDRETFITPTSTIRQQKLPELEYRLRPTRLGPLPLYLKLESSVDSLSVERGETVDGQYERADLFPQLTIPVRAFPWLSLSVTGGGRLTWYGDSFDPRTQTFTGQSLTRTFPAADAEVIGPSFSRIFDARIGPYGKFKHIIEPRWSYNFLGDFEDQDTIPLFDEVDTFRATNVGRFALINRLLAKPLGDEGGAREILSFEVAQAVSLDDDQPLQRSLDGTILKREGPLTALFRYNPSARVSLQTQVAVNTIFDTLEASSLSGSYGFGGGNALGLTWFTRRLADTGETLGNQFRVFGAVSLIPNRLRIEGAVNYDANQDLIQQQRWTVQYTSQCFSLYLEVRDFDTGIRQETDYRFSFSLKHVGTFLDLTGRR